MRYKVESFNDASCCSKTFNDRREAASYADDEYIRGRIVFLLEETDTDIYSVLHCYDTEPSYYKRMERVHGPVINRRMDAYHDVTVYADGHEERFYIGD